MEELDVKMIHGDSSRGHILECDLGKYYFIYLYIHAYFIKCNVSFLYILENPRDFLKRNVSFLCISNTINFMIYTNITNLHQNATR